MKHYYIREHARNKPITQDVGENLLAHRGYRVFEETETICIISKG